jgi:hypothetical protein
MQPPNIVEASSAIEAPVLIRHRADRDAIGYSGCLLASNSDEGRRVPFSDLG